MKETMERKVSLKKVLVAVRPGDLHIVSSALGSEFDLIICHTVEDALAHLDEPIGLIACGVRFSNGRMFDLLRTVKENPNSRQVPFYLLLGEGTKYSRAILTGIRRAAEVLGANGFTDLSRLENNFGREQTYERLRTVIRQHLAT